jgi:hypothetical protein
MHENRLSHLLTSYFQLNFPGSPTDNMTECGFEKQIPHQHWGLKARVAVIGILNGVFPAAFSNCEEYL